jgi:hypothetical protein
LRSWSLRLRFVILGSGGPRAPRTRNPSSFERIFCSFRIVVSREIDGVGDREERVRPASDRQDLGHAPEETACRGDHGEDLVVLDRHLDQPARHHEQLIPVAFLSGETVSARVPSGTGRAGESRSKSAIGWRKMNDVRPVRIPDLLRYELLRGRIEEVPGLDGLGGLRHESFRAHIDRVGGLESVLGHRCRDGGDPSKDLQK